MTKKIFIFFSYPSHQQVRQQFSSKKIDQKIFFLNLIGDCDDVDQSERSGACIVKLITAVIYGFRNKLECLSLNTRLGWKGLPGTNTMA